MACTALYFDALDLHDFEPQIIGSVSIFRDAAETSVSRNLRAMHAEMLKKWSLSRAARARAHWEPPGASQWGGPGGLSFTSPHSLGLVCTWIRARALRVDGCGAEQVGEGGTNGDPVLGTQSSPPPVERWQPFLSSRQPPSWKSTPWAARSFTFSQEARNLDFHVKPDFSKWDPIFQTASGPSYTCLWPPGCWASPSGCFFPPPSVSGQDPKAPHSSAPWQGWPTPSFIDALPAAPLRLHSRMSLCEMLFFLSSEAEFIRFSGPSWVLLCHKAFPRPDINSPSLDPPACVIRTSLTGLVTWGSAVSACPSLSMVESETIPSASEYKQQGLAQCLEYSGLG